MPPPVVPQSATFAWDVATRALDEQLHRVDALDTKAAALLAADVILFGLALGGARAFADVPQTIDAVAGIGIMLSMAATLTAFATRDYELAPHPGLVAELSNASEEWIRWRLLGNVLAAIDTNRARLGRKARWLAAGQGILLVAIAPLGGYFVWQHLPGGL